MAILDFLVSELGVLIGIALVILVVWKVGKFLPKIILGLLTNSVLGLVVLFLANAFFSVKIPVVLPVVAAVALFGLPGAGTIIILHLGLLV